MVCDDKPEDVKKSEEWQKQEVDSTVRADPAKQSGKISMEKETAREHLELSKPLEAPLGHDEVTSNYDPEALSNVHSASPPYSVFGRRQKHFIVFLAAWGGFFSPLSANIYFPALTTLTHEYRVSSTLMNLTLTSYMIFQGLAPTIFGDLADMA